MIAQQAVEILRHTSDGSKLSPQHLALVQGAVNGRLNDLGVQAFEKLHAQVSSGEYAKPWFFGIKHLTIDHEGYVYWRGVHVEHFSSSLWSGPEGSKAAHELADICRHLERLGVQPDAGTAIWHRSWFLDRQPGDPYVPLLGMLPGLYENGQHLAFVFPSGTVVFEKGSPDEPQVLRNFDYHEMRKMGYDLADCRQGGKIGAVYATGANVVAKFGEYGVPVSAAKWIAEKLPDADRTSVKWLFKRRVDCTQ